MKIVKAVLPVLLAIITLTSCTGTEPPVHVISTQVVEPAIPAETSTPTNEETPLINPTTTPVRTESGWTYEYIATVPIASVTNATQEEIANLLFTQWLNHFKTEEADLDHRLEDFELLSVVIREEQSPDVFVAMITFSVKPTKMSSWLAGNGISDGVWVRRKLLFISVEKEKDTYSLISMGTGP